MKHIQNQTGSLLETDTPSFEGKGANLTDSDLIEMLKLMQKQKETIEVLNGSVAESARQLVVMDMELNSF